MTTRAPSLPAVLSQPVKALAPDAAALDVATWRTVARSATTGVAWPEGAAPLRPAHDPAGATPWRPVT